MPAMGGRSRTRRTTDIDIISYCYPIISLGGLVERVGVKGF